MNIAQWLSIATRPSVVRRSLKYALVVGAVLISINHLDAIVRGDVDAGRVLKMGLTVVVPYLVSTFSSVGAIIGMERKGGDGGGRES